MNTAKKIESMLKENTSIHMLDSGSAYGRNWQKNQIRDFKKERSCSYEANIYNDNEWELVIEYNIYYYLTNFLILGNDTRHLNIKFKQYCNLPENKNNPYLQDMETFLSDVLKVNYNTINTYNYDNLLSQVIQYCHFQYNNNDFIILQIHGGCDVRDGYTQPYIFKVSDFDYFCLAQYDVNLLCSGKKHTYNGGIDFKNKKLEPLEPIKENCTNNWISDDGGYNWYFLGSSEDQKPLKDTAYIKDDKLYCKECQGELILSVIGY